VPSIVIYPRFEWVRPMVEERDSRKSAVGHRRKQCWSLDKLFKRQRGTQSKECLVGEPSATENMPLVLLSHAVNDDRCPIISFPRGRGPCPSICRLALSYSTNRKRGVVSARMFRPRRAKIIEVYAAAVWGLVKEHRCSANRARRIRNRETLISPPNGPRPDPGWWCRARVMVPPAADAPAACAIGIMIVAGHECDNSCANLDRT
jgi:hypothetical protein